MEPVSRLAARLFDLSHAQLLEIAAAGCEASIEVMNRADAILAAHKPLPQWAVEGVLLSSDLVPHLLAPLELEDGAAAAVCSRWAGGWVATSEGRRHLTRVAFDFPPELLDTRAAASFSIAVIPGGDERLVVRSGSNVRILPRDMSSATSFELPTKAGDVAAGEQFLYTTGTNTDVISLTYDGVEVASYIDPDKTVYSPVLAPGGLLFCALSAEGNEKEDEIIALDALTMEPRYRFGLSMLNHGCGLVVMDEELLVCDRDNHRIQVFSLAGEHRRSITGEWKRPIALCFVKDRLYLVEGIDELDVDDEGELIDPLHGCCILVLSLQGDTLEVYTNPVEGQTFGETLCYFDGKLLASVQDEVFVGVSALRGL